MPVVLGIVIESVLPMLVLAVVFWAVQCLYFRVRYPAAYIQERHERVMRRSLDRLDGGAS